VYENPTYALAREPDLYMRLQQHRDLCEGVEANGARPLKVKGGGVLDYFVGQMDSDKSLSAHSGSPGVASSLSGGVSCETRFDFKHRDVLF
jgi:hypothetical protein